MPHLNPRTYHKILNDKYMIVYRFLNYLNLWPNLIKGISPIRCKLLTDDTDVVLQLAQGLFVGFLSHWLLLDHIWGLGSKLWQLNIRILN